MVDKTRTAPAGLTLSVPVYVRSAGAAMGVATVLLGLIYLLVPPSRDPDARRTTIAVLEPYLGTAMVVLGILVVLATIASTLRAVAHGVTAVAHGAYVFALITSFLALDPIRPSVASVLSIFAVIAHGGASIDYWQRGHR
jgi:hypothetical protein